MDSKNNKEVMEEAGQTRSLFNKIRRRQAVFLGHIMRGEGLEHLVNTRKLEERRGMGREKKLELVEERRSMGRKTGQMMDSVATWMNID